MTKLITESLWQISWNNQKVFIVCTFESILHCAKTVQKEATDSGGGILLGSMSQRKSLLRACSDVQRRAGSRVSIKSSKSRAAAGKLCRRRHIHQLYKTDEGLVKATLCQCSAPTYKANSSRSRRLYCFLGFMVLKRGSFMTSGQAAGQGLPHRRLTETKQDGVMGGTGTKRIGGRKSCSWGYYLWFCIQEGAAYLMSSNCSSSWLAWKIGLLVKSSPKIHLRHHRE